jgi:hypothetical protein
MLTRALRGARPNQPTMPFDSASAGQAGLVESWSGVCAQSHGMVGGAAFAWEADIDASSASSHRSKRVGNGDGEVLS